MEYKYTNDGKKVAVIGKLNNVETIVQEVFVVGGNEVPSGENFVVKSLHDAPAISWQQSEINKMELVYAEAKVRYEKELDLLRDKREKATAIYKACAEIIKNTNSQMFEAIATMISGDIKYIVVDVWTIPEIRPVTDFIIDKDGYQYSVRLMSLFGKSNGDFSWNINRWRDDSGGWTTFYPYQTMDEALEKARELIESKKEYSEKSIEFLKENKLPLNEEKLGKYLENKKTNLNRELEKAMKEVEQLRAKIEGAQ